MKTLYESSFEHDACGIGAVVNINGLQSRKIIDDALSIVEKLEHRAGKDASGETGDGVGIMVQVSQSFFTKATKEIGIKLPGLRDYGIGMFFFSQNEQCRIKEIKIFENLTAQEDLKILGWRNVPINKKILGKKALDCMPCIMQCFIERPQDIQKGLEFDRRLYILRRLFENAHVNTYVCSLSSRTIVYKGMFLVNQLRTFYLDLMSEDYISSFAIVHSRFSTNTNPSWNRAHPNRLIAHNGEINTIRGNVDRMTAREESFKSVVMSEDQFNKILPPIDVTGSDSAMLDNALEFFMMNGMPLPLAAMVCIPEPWRNDENMDSNKKDFYHYFETMMESWDGPAAIIFSDGDFVGATLDRNGLRPARYYLTNEGTLILSSEVGVLEIPEEKIIKKARLEPGKMLLIDLNNKCIVPDEIIKKTYANKNPYGEWLNLYLKKLKDLKIPNKKIPVYKTEERLKVYKNFGWSAEDINEMILPLAKTGIEPTGSMGVDSPLAVLSNVHPSLFNYFKQLFAQVTNPPLDSLREKIVTDTTVYLGSDGNLLNLKADNCAVLEITNPVLTGVDVLKLKALNTSTLKTSVISLLFEENKIHLEEAMTNLFASVDKEIEAGSNILILSDRGVDLNNVAIPSLLAVSGVEQYLVRTKRRTKISVVLESGEIRNVHQTAMILSYGARAVNPYLAHECIAELIDKGTLDKDYHTAIDDYNKGLINGVVKIAAKMGISTIHSYQSAQIFEAVGICDDVIQKYFTNTVSRIEGITLQQIEDDLKYHHDIAFNSNDNSLSIIGTHRFHSGSECDSHILTPQVIKQLQDSTQNCDYKKFNEYASLIDDMEKPCTIRSLLEFNFDESKAIDISEVESVDSIVRRFKTGAMSYGSISQEAHECIAIAMNHLHGKSNSGEGGEKKERFGTSKNSAIKQIASGRFGVTEEYLLSAKEIQIKIAQGAKPGEGGHLPGKKVHPWIAETRYSKPGVTLISPPPHHDIYSIEDLAQLIYDLKNANRSADISVKLVSEAGVGTIASGAAKAGAQIILISGHDGGTGAAPLSSIHHAGLPWEMGLSEAHQTLVKNGLRKTVILETDGKLMTGKDVAVAALLGAEEFSFATAPLITIGCRMLRVCSLDTCPYGIATQNEKLRKNFIGKPEYIENFMKFTAQQLREIMAKLGYKDLSEMCGHSEKLKINKNKLASSPNVQLLNLSRMLNTCNNQTITTTSTDNGNDSIGNYYNKEKFNFKLNQTIDEKILLKQFEQGNKIFDVKVTSTDRTIGTILGSEITKKIGSDLPEDTYIVNCSGGAGLSFGAFIPKGLTLKLCGDTNDYIGKGLSGGKLIIKKPENTSYQAEENIIIGNVALYGATSGKAFINGIAGERFCVRNSGAKAVVEGCGNHALEYMTGGTAVILGAVGNNLGAGMSGGTAYVYDKDHELYKKINKESVNITDRLTAEDITELQTLIEQHVNATNSEIGKTILSLFDTQVQNFKKVCVK